MSAHPVSHDNPQRFSSVLAHGDQTHVLFAEEYAKSARKAMRDFALAGVGITGTILAIRVLLLQFGL